MICVRHAEPRKAGLSVSERTNVWPDELAKVYDWLAVNKLSLNVKKTKYVIFHAINKIIEDVVPDLEINGIPLERVQSFNFLGLLLNESMSWKPHIDLLSNKLAQ